MKKSLQRRVLTAGAALCISVLAAVPAFAADLSGHLDSADEGQIAGWAWDKEDPASAVTVELTLSGAGGPGGSPTVTVTADQSRSDLKKALGSSNHAFTYTIDWDSYETDTITVTAEAVSGGTRTPLDGSLTVTKPAAKKSRTKKAASLDGENESSGSVAKASANDEGGANGPGFGGGGSQSSPEDSESENGGKLEAGKRFGPSADNTAVSAGVQGDYLGEFSASGYCNCSRCSGGHNLTYSGTVPKAGHTIAADTSVFPIGTKIMIDGVVYTVEDIGGGVNGNRLDIFFASHQEAVDYGLKRVKVYSVK